MDKAHLAQQFAILRTELRLTPDSARAVYSKLSLLLGKLTDRTLRVIVMLALRAIERSEIAGSRAERVKHRRLALAHLRAAYLLVKSNAFRERQP